MTREIELRPLTATAFAPFGDVLEPDGQPDKMINEGNCGRFHDRARLFFGPGGEAGISIFDAGARELPYRFDLVERHPLGSQAFLPMGGTRSIFIVCPDEDGVPGAPLAFLGNAGQGVNILANTWHGVCTPLDDRGVYAVVDWIGSEPNLQEYRFDAAWTVVG
ncbi:ureidoglycolate lyase [Pelagovum pacificum]|uniref:Ureidoglycolate lyase n=1 Tax=Pelagovum pacificum TaxID=2588711 RepID=A0A5C5G944_9RHOB|nr:ureidoglycolate lyase [Pelagovum pacificum]QQA42153.1 ureidoglycolate lyase [Pelagovum pacificum]TNY31241.1 ureidoglycolate lyase [Pelagovum pacificum]